MSIRNTMAGRVISLVTMTVAAFAMAATAPAHAASNDDGPTGFGILVFHGSDIRQYSLTCLPDGGQHPDPSAACDQLRKADGNLLTLRPGADPSCKAPETDPVDVEIMGTWNGIITVFNERYPNPACAEASAGLVVPIH
ncbi:SSI family serine proteinase inhibitor [Streptomyces sp. x-80]|uniref:SSI family serine proteinase inhibitor n=1 Tax=Streptomyces sp. x-80 TaxID=2789282 RepID=UPI00397F238B